MSGFELVTSDEMSVANAEVPSTPGPVLMPGDFIAVAVELDSVLPS